MLKEFFIQCMCFRSKNKLNLWLGLFVWLNIIFIILGILTII